MPSKKSSSSSSSQKEERRKASRRDADFVAEFRDKANPYQSDAKSASSFNFAHLRYRCAECGLGGEEGERLLACSKCNATKYCGMNCHTAAWKRVHKHTCGEGSGFPTLQKLNDSSFRELAIVLDEWGACCTSIPSSIEHKLSEKSSLVQEANPLDVLLMASSISRILESSEPAVKPQICSAAGSLTSELIRHVEDKGRRAMASTTLFGSTIRCFLAQPRFSDLVNTTDIEVLTGKISAHHCVTTALEDQLTDLPIDCSPFHNDLSQCADATMQDIASATVWQKKLWDVRATLADMLLWKTYADHCSMTKLNLAVKLAYRGFAPSMVHDLKSIFEVEMRRRSESDCFREAVERWAVLARMLNQRCNVDAKKLVKAVYKVIRAHFGNDKTLLLALDKNNTSTCVIARKDAEPKM